ncbi:hypothetical protein Tco_0975072 [Tanacetum coccineum]|uniref:Reverse transcriptase domain-containing protein n=1 Tax=Tanacetum coccineum TaxID=301880 RepID=A0ABQ5EDE3_9ASTR
MLAQVSNRGNVRNQNGNVVNENVQENVGNVLVNRNWIGCPYKEFLACNPKEYDGKEGVVVLTRWIEKMENCKREVMDKFLEWSSGQATWSGFQDVGVVAKGLEWWPRVLLGAQGSNF